MHPNDTFPVLSLIVIITDISDVQIRLSIRRHRIMFLIWIICKVILEVFHRTLDVSLGSRRKNLVIGIRLLNALKVSAKEIFRI